LSPSVTTDRSSHHFNARPLEAGKISPGFRPRRQPGKEPLGLGRLGRPGMLDSRTRSVSRDTAWGTAATTPPVPLKGGTNLRPSLIRIRRIICASPGRGRRRLTGSSPGPCRLCASPPSSPPPKGLIVAVNPVRLGRAPLGSLFSSTMAIKRPSRAACPPWLNAIVHKVHSRTFQRLCSDHTGINHPAMIVTPCRLRIA
jgi:hypothetical protein